MNATRRTLKDLQAAREIVWGAQQEGRSDMTQVAENFSDRVVLHLQEQISELVEEGHED